MACMIAAAVWLASGLLGSFIGARHWAIRFHESLPSYLWFTAVAGPINLIAALIICDLDD